MCHRLIQTWASIWSSVWKEAQTCNLAHTLLYIVHPPAAADLCCCTRLVFCSALISAPCGSSNPYRIKRDNSCGRFADAKLWLLLRGDYAHSHEFLFPSDSAFHCRLFRYTLLLLVWVCSPLLKFRFLYLSIELSLFFHCCCPHETIIPRFISGQQSCVSI